MTQFRKEPEYESHGKRGSGWADQPGETWAEPWRAERGADKDKGFRGDFQGRPGDAEAWKGKGPDARPSGGRPPPPPPPCWRVLN